MRLLTFIFLLSSSVFALEKDCTALVRGKNRKLSLQNVTLKDLVSKTHFQGRYLKIVERNSEKAVSFGSSLSVRACTVYYHSTIAKDYFKKSFELKRLKRPRAITIRIEMDLGFEESVHMMHENNGLFYNNAVTIPPSNSSRIIDKSWFYEIWYAPKKKVRIDSSTYKAADLVSRGPFMASLLLGVGKSQATTIGIDLVRGSTFGTSFYFKTLGLSVGVTALVPNILKWISKPFKSTLYLDSGMIPEVIYHEYTHYALSEVLSIDTHAPVVEGIANYYAAMIGDSDAILDKTRGYSKGLVEINAKNTKNYAYSMEDKKYAQLDFSFKFLYGLKKTFGEEKASQLLFDAIKIMQKREGKELKKDLIPSLKKALTQKDSNLKTQILFNELLQKFGF